MKFFKAYIFTSSIFLYLTIGSLPCIGQNYIFDHYTQQDGLSLNRCHDVLEDSRGFIWISTDAGLNRFDGLNFKKYYHDPFNNESISSDVATKLYEDNEGYIWIYTFDKILNRFNPRTETFKRFKNAGSDESDLSQNSAFDFCEDSKGNFYMASIHGLCKYDPVTERINLLQWNGKAILPQIIKCIYLTRDERIIAGTEKGVFEIDIKTESVRQLPGTENIITSILSMDEDSNGNLWMGTWQFGLIKYNLTKHTLTHYRFDNPDENIHNWIFDDITVQKSGGKEYVWSTSIGSFLLTFDIESEQLRYEDLKPYFPEHPKSILTSKMMLDQHKGLWIATSYGLIHIDPLRQLFHTFKIPPQKPLQYYSSVTALYHDSYDTTGNTVWFTIPTWGLCKYNLELKQGEWFNAFKTPQRDEFTVTRIMRKDDDELWIGSYSGLIAYNTGTKDYKIYTMDSKNEKSISSNYISDFLYDNQNRLWVATYYDGLNIYNEACDCFQRVEIDSAKIPANVSLSENINDIALDKNGNIWVARGFTAGSTAAISMIHYNTLEETYYYQSDTYPTFPFQDEVFCILPDSYGNIWMGIYGGAVMFNPETDKTRFHYFTPSTGFQNSRVYNFIQGGNVIWATGNNGITLVHADSLKIIRSYMPEDGLLDETVSVMEPGFDGRIFFGDYAALQFIYSDLITPNKKIPPVYINNIKVLDSDFLINGTSALFNSEITFPFSKNKIRFEFSALNLTNPQNNMFAYKLEGADAEWTFSKSTFVNYNNLKPGKYVFRVKASNDNGIWNQEGDAFILVITPPWYQTIWFYIACVLFASGILYSIYRVRLNQLLRIERLRNKISRDLHDDVGSTLSSIHLLSKSASKAAESDQKKMDYVLQKISIRSEQMMENMSDIVWAVNPKNDALENILVRMRQYAAEVLEAMGIVYIFDVNPSIEKAKIPLEKRRDIYLLFKEAVNNLAKYSKCEEAVIRIFMEQKNLHLLIRDDGIGFDTNAKHTGNGLKNYTLRVQNIGGTCTITSRPGDGTEVHFIIPVK